MERKKTGYKKNNQSSRSRPPMHGFLRGIGGGEYQAVATETMGFLILHAVPLEMWKVIKCHKFSVVLV